MQAWAHCVGNWPTRDGGTARASWPWTASTPSTQLCHACGFKKDALTLADRTWTCPDCGVLHDRDLNAALNIRDEGLRLLAEGHSESLNACGREVRPPMAAGPVEARIPRL